MEVAIALPLLLILFSGVVDLAELMMTRDAMTVAAADGCRAGSVRTQPKGEDPVATAIATADQAWLAAERPQTAVSTAQIVGVKPNAMLVVHGEVSFSPWLGIVPMPASLAYDNTTRLTYQP